MNLNSYISFIIINGFLMTTAQYIDLFQGIQAILQPFQVTNNNRYFDITTRRPSKKHGNRKNTEKSINTFTTTKPRQLNSSHSRNTNKNEDILRMPWDFEKRTTTPKTRDGIGGGDNRYEKTTDINPSNGVNTEIETGKSNRNVNVTPFINNTQNVREDLVSKRTTERPLRPGVKPASVDESRPPITNRPAAGRPTTEPPDISPNVEIGPDEDEMSEVERTRYLDIAEAMCDNYKALSVKKVVALPLIPSPEGIAVNVSDCRPLNLALIIGGKISTIEEFPHMALIGWMNIQRNGYTWKCGASLVSEQYVLTAGHCTYHEKDYNVISGPPHAVQLGSSLIDNPEAVVIKVDTVVRHPKYKQRRSYYDIALIKMVSPVTFSDKIRPACLGVPPPVGNPIIATGWGRTELGGDNSNELRSVSLPIWDMQDCREIWGTSLKLPNGPTSESHVCAGERNGGKDTCQGDSGGPAQVQEGCIWRVVAVTSFGRSCGAPQTPALYAKVPIEFVSAQVFVKHRQQNNKQQNNVSNQQYSNRQQSNNGYGSQQSSQQYNNNGYGSQQQKSEDYGSQQQRPSSLQQNNNGFGSQQQSSRREQSSNNYESQQQRGQQQNNIGYSQQSSQQYNNNGYGSQQQKSEDYGSQQQRPSSLQQNNNGFGSQQQSSRREQSSNNYESQKQRSQQQNNIGYSQQQQFSRREQSNNYDSQQNNEYSSQKQKHNSQHQTTNRYNQQLRDNTNSYDQQSDSTFNVDFSIYKKPSNIREWNRRDGYETPVGGRTLNPRDRGGLGWRPSQSGYFGSTYIPWFGR